MARKKTAQELIHALKTLRLEEADLTAQLEEAIGDIEYKGSEQGPIRNEEK